MLARVRRIRLAAVGVWVLILRALGECLFLLAWLPLKVGRFCLWLADRIDAGSDALAAYAASLATDPERDTRAGGAP